MPGDPLAPVLHALAHVQNPSSDFDLNKDVILPTTRRLRPAGVLVLIRVEGSQARMILTMRSSALEHHPGQIAFAGGKQDAGDVDVIATALREAREEIGLDPSTARILGTLPTHETVTGFTVTPVVGLITGRFDPLPEQGEVAEVFEVPLSHLLDPSRYRIEARRWQGAWRRYYTVPYGPYYIWGATARILRQLAGPVAGAQDHED